MSGEAPSGPAMTVERLKQFSDTWDSGDVDAILAFFTEDCVFQPSVEETPNRIFRGKAEVAEEFRRIFARDDGYESRSGLHFVCGSMGYCEWSLVVRETPELVEIRGCDFFEFSGDLIARKDAYRKVTKWLDSEG